MSQQLETGHVVSLHPDTSIGFTTLTIANLDRSLTFYKEVLGFQVLKHDGQMAVLGATENQPLLVLVEQANASPKPHSTTGLYHFAILVPSRADLGRSLARLAEMGYRLDGASDHLVSEALYLSDPDGNGIEIYRDRPRSEWHWRSNQIQMATERLDLKGVLRAAEDDAQPWNGLAPQTTIGHMHLQIADIRQGEAFYHGILGFDITVALPGALFLSAGGYHHHIGLNTWNSRGAPRPPANSAGLRYFTITLKDKGEQEKVVARLKATKVPFEEHNDAIALHDPWSNGILLTIGSVTDLDKTTSVTSFGF
jgi:catechol 2,3-dioxygenase